MKNLIKLILGPKFVNVIRVLKFKLITWLPIKIIEPAKRREIFYKQFVNKNDLVFDVGANIGNRTQPLLNIGAKVVAIEPQKECYESLKSRFGNKIKIVTMGLGAKEELKDFYISNAHTISSFSTEWIESVKKDRFKYFTWAKPIKVQITTLDTLIKKYGSPKFIKIDVEGYELEVLKGLTCAVDIISFEYTVPEQVQKAIDCIIQIEKYNPKTECNYSVGEKMELALKNWETTINFKKFLLSQEFISTGFGDIYIRTINSSEQHV
jgi:FkbM family methyltransferase